MRNGRLCRLSDGRRFSKVLKFGRLHFSKDLKFEIKKYRKTLGFSRNVGFCRDVVFLRNVFEVSGMSCCGLILFSLASGITGCRGGRPVSQISR